MMRRMASRTELDALMTDLERQVPKLIDAIPVEFHLEAWAQHADEILEQAGAEDHAYVFDCLEAMALRNGLIVGTFGSS